MLNLEKLVLNHQVSCELLGFVAKKSINILWFGWVLVERAVGGAQVASHIAVVVFGKEEMKKREK